MFMRAGHGCRCSYAETIKSSDTQLAHSLSYNLQIGPWDPFL